MINNRKKLVFYAVMLFTFCVVHSRASENKIVNVYQLVSVAGSNIPVIDNSSTLNIQDAEVGASGTDIQYIQKVRLLYPRNRTSDFGTANWTVSISYTITDQVSNATQTGTISINSSTTSSKVYQAEQTHKLGGNVAVTGLTINTTGVPQNVLNDVKVELELTKVRHKDIGASSVSSGNFNLRPNGNELLTYWDYVDGAESYEFQWVYVDALDNQYSNINSSNAFDIKNPVNIVTSEQYYSIYNNFNAGNLFFRVRPMGYYLTGTGDYSHVEYGAWSLLGSYNISSGSEFQKNYNWQYSVNYAEDGLNKRIVSYADGSLRTRQTLTNLSTDGNTAVASQDYDYEGRASFSTAAVPEPGFNLSYHPSYNKKNSTDAFTKDDYDKKIIFSSGNLMLNPLDINSGASKYYSANNPFQTLNTDYIPDAGGYPYSQVQYTRDGTGRVARSGGVGQDFQIGSGRETQYFYATTNDAELHRLFGSNVGIASHYKKNYVVDPNGQTSVSYLDQEGRAIATALSGVSPVNVNSLAEPAVPITSSLNGNNVLDKQNRISQSVSKVSNVIVNTQYQFEYDFTGVINSLSAPFNLCLTCKYDLSIAMTDPDGNVVSLNDVSPGITGGPVTNITRTFNAATGYDCSTNQFTGNTVNFNVTLSNIGVYTVTKTLTMTDGELADYISNAVTSNGYPSLSATQSQINSTLDQTVCDMTCNQFRVPCMQDLGYYTSAVTTYDQLTTSQKSDVDNCVNTKCANIVSQATDQVHQSDCQNILDQITGSIKPKDASSSLPANPDGSAATNGVQYNWWGTGPMPSSITVGTAPAYNVANFYLPSNDGSIPNSNFTPNFVAMTDDVANALAQYHREYCHYTFCMAKIPSSDYDAQMSMITSFTQAQATSGNWQNQNFFDPLGLYSSGGDPYFLAIKNDAVGTETRNLYEEMKYRLYCDHSGYTNANYQQDAASTNVSGNYPNNVSLLESVAPPGFTNIYPACSGAPAGTVTWTSPFLGMPSGSYTGPPSSTTYPVQTGLYGNLDWTNIDQVNQRFWSLWRGQYQGLKLELITQHEKNVACAFQTDANTIVKDQTTLPQTAQGATNYINSNMANYDQMQCDARVDGWYAILNNLCAISHYDYYNNVNLISGQTKSLADYLRSYCYNHSGMDNPMAYIFSSDVTTDPDLIKASLVINQILYLHNTATCGPTDLDCCHGIDDITTTSPYTTTYTNPSTGVTTTSQPVVVSYINPCLIEMLNDISTNNVSPIHTDCILTHCNLFNNGCNFASLSYFTRNIHSNYGKIGCCDKLISNCEYGGDFNISYNTTSGDNVTEPIVPVENVHCTCDVLFAIYDPASSDFIYSDQIAANGISNIVLDQTAAVPATVTASATSGNYAGISMTITKTNGTVITGYLYLNNTMAGGDGKQDCNPNLILSRTETPVLTLTNNPNPTIDVAQMQINCLTTLQSETDFWSAEIWQQQVDNFTTSLGATVNNCFENPFKEDFFVTYTLNEYHYTLYYYDQAGDLIQTVPPEGVKPLSTDPASGYFDNKGVYLTGDPAHTLWSRYKFNSLAGVTWQHSPDGGNTDFYYDSKGELKVSQNDKQRSVTPNAQYSLTEYDGLYRIKMVEQVTPATPLSLSRTTLDDPNYPLSMVSGGVALNRNDITWTDYSGENANFYTGQNIDPDNSRGRVSASVHYDNEADIGTNMNASMEMYSYDAHGNVHTLYNQTKELSMKRTDYDYDLISGKVKQVSYQPGEPDQFYHKYEYDADNRITNVYTSSDAQIWEEDAQYFYYPHGPLARVEIGEDKIQGLDYYYTLHGWIKGVNGTGSNAIDPGMDGVAGSTVLNGNSPADQMSYALGYYQGDYTPIRPTNINLGAADASSWTAFNPMIKQGTGTTKLGLFNGNITSMVTDMPSLSTRTQAMVYQYDQLNRLVQSRSNQGYVPGSGWTSRTTATASASYDEDYSYDKNGNILTLLRYDGSNTLMDDLHYSYDITTSNRLQHVWEQENTPASTTGRPDILRDDAGPNYHNGDPSAHGFDYTYDNIGNLISDKTANIANIKWTVYGKIDEITYGTGSTSKNLKFEYDAKGNRIAKIVKNGPTQDQWDYTLYSRDASGNVMSIYTKNYVVNGPGDITENIYQEEIPLYGSARLGEKSAQHTLIEANELFLLLGTPYDANGNFNLDNTMGTWDVTPPSTAIDGFYSRSMDTKSYELSNHLGNVLTTVSDLRQGVDVNSDGVADYYTAMVKTASDYYPFGMQMPGRQISSSAYRYGFNGKENDNEVKGTGNSVDFGDRIYDTRIGKWLAVDLLFRKAPFVSPYSFASNTPMQAIDPDGKKVLFVNGYYNSRSAISGITGSQPGKEYWSGSFINSADKFFNDNNNLFIDGRGKWNSSGADRYKAGYEYAKANYATITEGIFDENGKQKENINVVSHSMGAAYSEGMIKYLEEQNIRVASVVHLSAADPSGFKASTKPYTLQLSLENDAVLGYKNSIWNSLWNGDKIDGVDRYGIVKTDAPLKDDLLSNHANTKFVGDTWKQVEDLKSIELTQTGNTLQTPWITFTGPSNQYTSGQSEQNGTQFKTLDVNDTEYKSNGSQGGYTGPLKW